MDISVKDLSYTYHSRTPYETQVLKNISLEITAGSWVSLIGRTGSGKSTLVQHMNGLYTPTSGSVQIGDTLLTSQRKKKVPLFDQVGMVFQYPEHQLFEESVKKDISFGPKNLGWPEALIESRVDRVMEQLGLSPELAERSPFQLSGGQKRRVALAGILVMDPQILILDEPTAGLDPQGKKSIMELIHSWHIAEKRTVVTITHQMEDVAEYSDQVVVLEEGQVKWQTDPYTLFTVYAEELERMGLELPRALQLVRELNEGLKEPFVPVSIKKQDVFKQLAHFLNKGGHHGSS